MNKVFLLFFSFVLIFSGCGSSNVDCSSGNTDYVVYSYNEETETCDPTVIAKKNVCGNGIIEKENDETHCSCPEDVDKNHPELGCFGKKGDYLEYSCDEVKETCELEMTDNVKPNKVTREIEGEGYKFDAIFEYNEPLIIDREKVITTLFLKSLLNTEEAKVKNIIIKKASILTEGGDILSDVTVNKVLKEQYDEIEIEFTLDHPFQTFSKKFYDTQIRLFVNYDREIYDDGTLVKTIPESRELKRGFDDVLELINPENDAEEEESVDVSGWK